jgi:nitronate monooxygenase
MLTPDGLRDELAATTSRTPHSYNVNFFCHSAPAPDQERDRQWRGMLAPYYHEFSIDARDIPPGPARTPFNHDAADVLAQFQPPVVSFHFGLPSRELLDRVRQSKATILSSATTIEEARWLEAQGVDAIIAQGLEAGGHRGMFLSDDVTTQVGTLALVRQIVRVVKVPVIAAGGIADADGVVAALALGAAAVQIGTAYLLCPEATTTAVHREALSSSRATHTVVTNVFTGRPARSIVNRLVAEMGPLNPAAPQFPLAVAAILPLRRKAESRGSGDFSPLWSGQNATGCKNIPAAVLTREFAARV